MVELCIQAIGSFEYKVGTFNEFKPLVSVNLFSDLFKEHVLILFQNFSILHMNHLRNIFGACNNTEGLLLNLRRELQGMDAIKKMKPRDFRWHPLVPVPKLLKLLSLPPDLAD